MNNQILIYLILLSSFTAGGVYNFRKRKQCNYNVRIRKSMIITLIISTLIFLIIAYIGGNTWYNYLLSISASIFLVSGLISQGFNEIGIYYLYGRGILVRFAKWEDIKDIKFDVNKNKLLSFKLKTLTIFVNQYYRSEDIYRLNNYMEDKDKE